MKMSYELIGVLATLLLSLMGGFSSAFRITVPHVSRVVHEAGAIVGGVVDFDESDKPVIIVDEVFKGDLSPGGRIGLRLKHTYSGVSLRKFLMPYRGQRVIVLGHYNEAMQVLELPWLISTIWPYGYKAGEFPSETYAECKEFIVSMLMYETMAVDKEVLISKLLDDIRVPDKRCAVLCFSYDMLSAALDDKELERGLLAVFMTEIAAPSPTDPNGVVEACVVNNVANLMPVLPASICATYLANVSTQKGHSRAQLAFTRARTILTIRRMIERTEVKTPVQLKVALREKLGPLRVLDAKKAMRLFDSPNPRLKQAAERVVGLALGVNEKPDASVEDRKAFWEKKIQEKEDKLPK